MKLRQVAERLMMQGKGILAADESEKTMTPRLLSRGVESSPETRRRFRELLVTTAGIDEYVSGVIFYDETLRQTLADGTPFADALVAQNILPGIKVDAGLQDDSQFEGGQVTDGLEGLAERLVEYKTMGVRFTKWRSVSHVHDIPGNPAMRENASRLAAYAALVLEAELVPIVEAEVVMSGMHTAAEAESAIVEFLSVVVDALSAKRIDLKNVIFKTSMAVSGAESDFRVPHAEVAERTVRALSAALPEEIGGVVFLSGGQEPDEALANLNAIARLEPLPWPITYSFSRAIQDPVMDTWSGNEDNVGEAQGIFLQRLSLLKLADAAGYVSGQNISGA
ncbi:MAG: class I fructose-bisphosphate aldolase [Patescibacteria group bacterium]